MAGEAGLSTSPCPHGMQRSVSGGMVCRLQFGQVRKPQEQSDIVVSFRRVARRPLPTTLQKGGGTVNWWRGPVLWPATTPGLASPAVMLSAWTGHKMRHMPVTVDLLTFFDHPHVGDGIPLGQDQVAVRDRLSVHRHPLTRRGDRPDDRRPARPRSALIDLHDSAAFMWSRIRPLYSGSMSPAASLARCSSVRTSRPASLLCSAM